MSSLGPRHISIPNSPGFLLPGVCELEQEIEDLMKQSYSASACVDVSCSIPDLAPALRDMKMESEGIAAKNLQEIDEWYKTRFLDFNQPSTKHAENVRRFREEIGNCKRSTTSLLFRLLDTEVHEELKDVSFCLNSEVLSTDVQSKEAREIKRDTVLVYCSEFLV
ncbi:glycerophosphodiester phosphodiesterase domain-containing protein 5-like [Platysternon megacephalum]|uniref:Glycerophosphodiester phosphodiesterase domain-containing protein 5-like n=1 Tax=Platysternon megacephalum TaxID=55544 RepID=A0A4D9EUY9_9SAUR|nr:glycerophosphodiester phosphodiesterase domain-containing protein 5-like [Platysternon megacephalum]